MKKNTTTSKKLIWFLFANCTIIEIVVFIVTFQSLGLAALIGVFPDFTPLITLIGTIVGEVISFAIYALKSAKENSKGGITYDTMMMENHYNENSYNEEKGQG